jgi:predicted O-methyltransferase YrrM
LSNIIGDPNITVFASAFSDITRSSAERTRAIDKLFLSNLDDLHSCWKGHRGFADWLVKRTQPKVTVDLGVDHGFSSFVFAIPRIGHVYGIDSFEGDQYAGERNDATYNLVLDRQEKLHLKENLTFIKGYFDDIAKDWDKTIDILHIDGDHAYESVKNDYETWSKFLSEDAVILFHDTTVDTINGNEYGVKRFFEELDLPKVNFTHTFGLGVASKNKELIEFIENNIPLDRPL